MRVIKGFRSIAYHGSIAHGDIAILDEQTGQNTKVVILTASAIEIQLEMFIRHHFYPKGCSRCSSQVDAFERLIMQSDMFTMQNKKRVYIELIRGLGLEGAVIERLDETLAKVIRYRNAFTHGRVHYEANGDVVLHYFQGGKQSKVLDETYLSSLEDSLQECVSLLYEVARRFDYPISEDLKGVFANG